MYIFERQRTGSEKNGPRGDKEENIRNVFIKHLMKRLYVSTWKADFTSR